MILILGGTTEGRAAVGVAEAGNAPYYYSTKGEGQEIALTNGCRITGALDAEAMEAFCREKEIRLLVDAAHPFAGELHRTVARVADRLSLPVVRYERKYPPRDPEITWCDTYEEAIERMEACGIGRLLALTGVQTIRRLAPFWQKHPCWFRILGRDESVSLALEQGFPAERLIAASPAEAPDALISRMHPDALLTKESGESGYFCEKIKAAEAAGIPVFAVKRPALPDSFIRVYGENGLRKAIERLVPGFFRLRSGYTTGACATAAAKAALQALLTGEAQQESTITLPGGEEVTLPVVSTVFGEGMAASSPFTATLSGGDEVGKATLSGKKNAGDDPDVTHGGVIGAPERMPEWRKSSELPVTFQGEEKVNTVTGKQEAGDVPLAAAVLGKEDNGGVPISAPVSGQAVSGSVSFAACTVIKDAGDDPDVTHGRAIVASVRLLERQQAGEPFVLFRGGEGVGTVTLPGLGLEVGGPAINATPRRMIEQALREVLATEKASGIRPGLCWSPPSQKTLLPEKASGRNPGSGMPHPLQKAPAPEKACGTSSGCRPPHNRQVAPATEKVDARNPGFQAPHTLREVPATGKSALSPDTCRVEVTISVPGGREIALRTFNPKLGIEGGISIIGTSGIVRPFSSEAFVASIRKEIEVAAANGIGHLVINSGAKSERFLKARYPELPPQAFVHYGNFIGETLRIAAATSIPQVTMGIMIGKAVKLAEGFLDTHSKNVTVNRAFLREIARRAGYPDAINEAINRITLARELWNLFPLPGGERFFSLLAECCLFHCTPLLPGKMFTLLLIDEKGHIWKG